MSKIMNFTTDKNRSTEKSYHVFFDSMFSIYFFNEYYLYLYNLCPPLKFTALDKITNPWLL